MKKVFFGLTVAVLAVIGITAFKPAEERKDLVTYPVLIDYSKVEWVGSKNRATMPALLN